MEDKLKKSKSAISHSKLKEEMDTLSSCVNALTAKGFNTQFAVIEQGLKSLATEVVYKPEEVKIVSFYRFEGDSDPADNSILYAIETNNGEKGTLSDAYGMYNDADISTFIKEVEGIEKKPHDKIIRTKY